MVHIKKEVYNTLLRSHTDEILAADYNSLRNNVITVSNDHMIRIWEVEGSFQKIYEFVSPNDQAISVASHPSEPLFACGFESGSLRVFDIDNTKVIEIFNQFNLPLVACTYSSDSRLLVTAAKDGYIAVHNAKFNHQPIKTIEVDFPPDFVTLKFDPTNTFFAAIGNYGSVVNIFDSYTF